MTEMSDSDKTMQELSKGHVRKLQYIKLGRNLPSQRATIEQLIDEAYDKLGSK